MHSAFRRFLILAALPVLASAVSAAETGLDKPESIIEHPASGELYCSNVTGVPTDQDGTGFISRIDRDGRVLDLRWLPVEGQPKLDAPKGMCFTPRALTTALSKESDDAAQAGAVAGDHLLWVADVDRVVLFDPAQRRQVAVIDLADRGVQFANDLAFCDDKVRGGTVYLSDSATDRLFALCPRGLVVLQEITQENLQPPAALQRPNGLASLSALGNGERREETPLLYGELLLGGYGEDGYVWQISPDGRAARLAFPKGRWDGIAIGKSADGAQIVYASDWETSGVWKQQGTAQAEQIAGSMQGPADFCLLKGGLRILVPVMLENRIQVVDLKE